MNNTSLKNTPKLRFSEFHDEWVFKELKQIAYKRTEKNRENLYSTVLTNSAVRGVVAQEDYFDRDIVSEGNTDGYYVVKENNFVYNPRVSKHAKVGPIKRNTYKTGIMSPLYTIFEFKEGDLDFFEHYFTSHYWHRYMQSISNIGARHDRMNVHDSEFLKIPLPYPDVNEQQKIAGFLTAVDDRISAMQEKVELLKNYKKGIMQKMFPPIGGQVPEIRFDGFNDKWEKLKLVDLLLYTPREVYKPKSAFLSIGLRSHFKGTFQKKDFDPNTIEMDKLFVINAGDLVVNITFAWE